MVMSDEKPKTTLAEEMHLLFDEDEDVKEWILLGRLPPDIAEFAADALEKKDGNPRTREISLGSPEPFMHIAGLIQRKFFPDAPPLERGGFMNMMMGGPAPQWMVIMQVAAQIVDKVRDSGFEVEPCEMENLADQIRDSADKDDNGNPTE
jgi:hypothetical protein